MIDIPGYTIKREVGSGGMASVFLAVQTSLEREVALKVMSPSLAADPTFTRRFLQEARMLASLAHPNIVQVFDVGVTNAQQHYFAMQYLSGGDFVARVERGLAEAELKRVLISVANALGYAHQRGYVHRDVAPGNILFDANDNPVLTDFGIALAAGEGNRITSTGFSVGTSHYMSPEQARGGDVDARSDLYSLGVLTWFGLTGAPPYDGADGFAVAYAHVFEPVPRLPAEQAHWQGLIDKALAKDPKDRYADVAQFTAALETIPTRGAAAAATVAAARPVTPRPGPAAPARVDAPASEPASTPTTASAPAPAAAKPAPKPAAPTVAPAVAKAPPAAAPAPRVEVLKSAPSSAPAKGAPPRWIWAAVGGIALVALIGVGVMLWPVGKPAPRVAPATTPAGPAAPTATAPVTAASPTSATAATGTAAASPPSIEPSTAPAASGGDVAAGTPAAASDTPAATAAPAAAADAGTAATPPDATAGLSLGVTDEQAAALALAELPTVVDPVVELVKLGRADLAAQRYTSPPGMNALERFRLALRIDKRDKAAKQGIVDTARAYLALADKARAANDTATMGQHFAKALEIAASLPEGKVVSDEVAQRRAALAAPFLEQAAKAAANWDKAAAKTAYDQALVFDPDNAAAKDGMKKLAAIGASGYVFRDKLADGSAGPEMIVAAGVGIGRREVTRGEFRRYWAAAGAKGGKEPSCRDRESIFRSSKKRNWQNPDISQDDSHPVVCVSWDEAAGFARWLSEETGKRYRLVSNGEWDQLARAAGGAGCEAANLADSDFAKAYDSKGASCSDGFAATAPAGHYAAAGGVYDIDGNVREWVNACGNGAAAGGGCRDHRYRGRAWLSPEKEPAGFADSASSDVAANSIGFRVAREIEQK